MFCVGLTGNIGSGKSVAAREFAALGADVVSADAISKALTAKVKALLMPLLSTLAHRFVLHPAN